MRLAEDGNDLRHLEPEYPVLVGERGAMTLRLVLLPFGRVRPDLDALPGQRDELIRRGREQAGHFTWAAAREGWHNVLAEAGVPLLGTGSGQMPALAQAALLAELEQIRLRLDVNWHSDHEALRALPRLVRRPALMIRALRLQRRLLERSLP